MINTKPLPPPNGAQQSTPPSMLPLLHHTQIRPPSYNPPLGLDATFIASEMRKTLAA